MRKMTFTMIAFGLVLSLLGTEGGTAPPAAHSQAAKHAAESLDPVPAGPALY